MVREFMTAKSKLDETGLYREENEFRVPKDKELLGNLKLKNMFQDIKFDPDQDGFNFGIVESFTLIKRLNFFAFIRKSLFANEARGFTSGAESLEKANSELKESMVAESWETPKNDLGLLMALNDKGIGFLR